MFQPSYIHHIVVQL